MVIRAGFKGVGNFTFQLFSVISRYAHVYTVSGVEVSLYIEAKIIIQIQPVFGFFLSAVIFNPAP